MIKVFDTYDVIILGGGASGIAAAIASSQNGAKTALIERSAYLGGKATAAYVGTICGAYLRSEKENTSFVTGGFVKQFVSELQALSGTNPVRNKEGLQYLPYRKSAFKLLCDDMIREAEVDCFLHSAIHDSKVIGKEIEAVTILNFDKNIKLKGKAFVDCTGDAILVDLLPIDHISSDQYQTSTHVFSVNNLTGNSVASFKLSMIKSLQKGMDEGMLTSVARRLSIMPGSDSLAQLYFKLSIPFEITDKINRMTDLNLYSRSLIKEIFAFLKKNNKNFKEANILQIEDEVGIRTGRRHLGKKILKREDVLKAKKDKHSIARGAWPIECWNMDSKPQMEYFEPDDFYDIPVECLCSNKLDNLYFAGRNLSADDGAIASSRVIGTCLQTGFAAGILASDSIKKVSLTDSIKKVQNKLEF